MARRNPPVTWRDPIQEQGPRQQARFLLQVEQAAAIRKGFGPACSVVQNPSTRLVLEAAGVPLADLPACNDPGYHQAIEATLKTVWKEDKKHPHRDLLMETKGKVSQFACEAGCTEGLTHSCSHESEARLSRDQEQRLLRWAPELRLNWRHQIADLGRALADAGGDQQAAGLLFSAADLQRIQELCLPGYLAAKAEGDRIRAERKAEFQARFGHQPTGNPGFAEIEEMFFISGGETMTELWRRMKWGKFAEEPQWSPLTGKVPPRQSDWLLLDLEPGATAAEIKQAYRQLAMQHHPDQGGEQEQFIAITEACQRLLAGAQR
ncbi:J domain-containing protein [Synechococcus sp. HK01-R]|uniref:J domain-containing protein n=1 Tax=Synechococcus sp. HK01-R TaxID=2751171 RepID=UPI0021047E7C|nr:J domain-containing protein [Synechococcus sp. HK01-R]